MTEKIYVITDLGQGDGGKGTVVHKVATMTDAVCVAKTGGFQGSHGMWNSDGQHFGFSQFGCATFEGIRTHITPLMVASPEGWLNEGNALRYKYGVHNAFDLLTIDERTVCATPYHGIASRLKELARGNNPRGTVGTGAGVTYRYSLRYPDLTIKAGDLLKPDLKNRIIDIREQIRLDLEPIVKGEFLPEDRTAARKEIALLYDDGFIDHIVERFQKAGREASVVDSDYFEREILSQDGIVVVERSHGVLTHPENGFHPHTNAIPTLPCFVRNMLKEAGYDGPIVDIGVTRAYAISHGARPMPTADPAMAKSLLPSSHKEKNRYQGELRAGPLDLVLLRYAIEVCGGPKAFAGLAITWFDQIEAFGKWNVCDKYRNTDDRTYFEPTGEIKVRRGMDEKQLQYQEALGKKLQMCEPEITGIELPPSATREELFSFCAGVLEPRLGVPVRMVSFGPTELDKVCI